MGISNQDQIKKGWEMAKQGIPPNERITCFDPGERTGVVTTLRGIVTRSSTLTFPELRDALTQKAGYEWLYTEWYSSDLWIIESFILYPVQAQRMGFNAIEPAKTEGYIKAFADIRGIKRMARQASIKEPFIPWAKCLYNHTTQHTADAHAHIIAHYLTTTGGLKSNA